MKCWLSYLSLPMGMARWIFLAHLLKKNKLLIFQSKSVVTCNLACCLSDLQDDLRAGELLSRSEPGAGRSACSVDARTLTSWGRVLANGGGGATHKQRPPRTRTPPAPPPYTELGAILATFSPLSHNAVLLLLAPPFKFNEGTRMCFWFFSLFFSLFLCGD